MNICCSDSAKKRGCNFLFALHVGTYIMDYGRVMIINDEEVFTEGQEVVKRGFNVGDLFGFTDKFIHGGGQYSIHHLRLHFKFSHPEDKKTKHEFSYFQDDVN